MTLESMVTLQGIVLIVLVVAAVGAVMTHVFRDADSPYLITITGSRAELVLFGALLWVIAFGVGFATLLIVATLVSPLIGIALFFGVEAVALDICAHRTNYVRLSSPAVEHARVRITPPFGT
jgi:hypothetical protein